MYNYNIDSMLVFPKDQRVSCLSLKKGCVYIKTGGFSTSTCVSKKQWGQQKEGEMCSVCGYSCGGAPRPQNIHPQLHVMTSPIYAKWLRSSMEAAMSE